MTNYSLVEALQEIAHLLKNDNQIINTFSVVSDQQEFQRVSEFVKENGHGIITLDVFWNLQHLHDKIILHFEELEEALSQANLPEHTKVLITLQCFKTLNYDPILETVHSKLMRSIKHLQNS
jgi:hypothetical protein